MLPDIIVSTPHKGEYILPLKEEYAPFLFGSTTQIERHTGDIVRDLIELEEEAKTFLLYKWLDSVGYTLPYKSCKICIENGKIQSTGFLCGTCEHRYEKEILGVKTEEKK